jgi:asparagine synthase (glutamine-hydrolysing)
MCGICGSVHVRPGQSMAAISEQLAVQRHRGPDAEGWFDGGRGVVAQNRLSVIDLVSGDPPLTTEDGNIGAVLNGELYNFQAIREQLQRDGHTLSSRGDTEVLVHLAEALSAREIATRIDGMFAFAIWDKRRERLMLGRDRFGKKPLYYWSDGNGLVFASELKGVLAHRDVPRELNPRAISAYLTFGYVPTPETFFRGIKSLPPGHVLTYEPGGTPTLERYWRMSIPGASEGVETLDIGMEEAARETRRLLISAIQRRLVSDVPLGAFLSGGIDSSAIVALMSGVMGEPVKTFTIGFDDRDGFDERPYARAVAGRFGTEHHEAVAHPETVELVERLVHHHDQPFGDSSAVPTFLLNEVAREHVTVALSGDGGDEVFAGYERFAAGVAMARLGEAPAWLRRGTNDLIARLPAGIHPRIVPRLQRFADQVDDGMPQGYLEWISFTPELWRQRLLAAPDDWARNDYAVRWNRTAGARTLDRLLALNMETYLVDDLLVKMDRTSMAHSLEVRSPFLDTALVEFAGRLPPSLKARGLSLKRVLKESVSDLLPPEILKRPKRGFGVPLDRWFREDLQTYTASALGAGASVRAHVNSDALDLMLAEHRAGVASHGHALWTLLTLEIFLSEHGW